MMKRHFSKVRQGITAVLDIGTTKICCWIAHKEDKNQFRIIGMGHQASQGILAGYVTDMGALEASIAQAVHEAEKASGETVRQVFMNVSGNYIESSLVNVEVSLLGQTVDEEDIRRLLLQARLEKDPNNYKTIHTLPIQYVLDGQKGIQDPIGMMGERLGTCVHVVSGVLPPLRNVLICAERCHLTVRALVASGYASGLACLVEDERALGVILLDIGGGATHVAGFWGGNLIYTACIPLGGNHITNDLARGLETSIHHAERLKVLYGASMLSENDQNEMIAVPQLGDLQKGISPQIPRATLIEIIQPRLEEIFRYVSEKLRSSGFDSLLGQRVVLTGGTSQLPGIRELGALILGKSVRVGEPVSFSSTKDCTRPDFSTAAGLLRYTQTEEFRKMSGFMGYQENRSQTSWGKITSWLRENL